MDDCKIRNNLFAKIFGFIFRSDKDAMLNFIKENDLQTYAQRQADKDSMKF